MVWELYRWRYISIKGNTVLNVLSQIALISAEMANFHIRINI